MDSDYSKSFKSIDIKAVLVDKDGNVDYLPQLQSFSISYRQRLCDMFCVIFEESNLNRIANTRDIVFYSVNEYGKIGFSYLKDISLFDYNTGVSIDDIVTEEKIVISFSKYQPWTKWPEVETEESAFALEVWNKWKSNREIKE